MIDPSLVHAILLDYDPETLSQHIDDIREQLGMLEASSVPDSNDMEQLATPTVSPSSESGRSPLHSVFATSNGGTAISSNPSIFSDNEDDGEPRTEEELLATFFPGLCVSVCLRSLTERRLTSGRNAVLMRHSRQSHHSRLPSITSSLWSSYGASSVLASGKAKRTRPMSPSRIGRRPGHVAVARQHHRRPNRVARHGPRPRNKRPRLCP